MQTEYEFDVFISYSSKNKAWVRDTLLKRIEQAGLKAFIDFRDFIAGAPSIKEMERGVEKCKKTLLILTPAYIESEWCEFEGIMAQTLSPANRDHRIIPLLRAKCQKPLSIGALTHIDFTEGVDLKLAWRQLLTALGKPPEPELPREPERNDWFLAHPYPMPPNFTGRLEERGMLSAWLYADPTHPMLVLRALGGFGKSALAWHWLIHDVKPASLPHVVWWSFYEGDASFDHFLGETLGYFMGEPVKPDKLSGKNAVKALVQKLHKPGTLLVLDGFERALRAFGGMDAAYQGDEPGADNSDCACISPLAEDFLRNLAALPNIKSKILLTTRLCPFVLNAKGGGLLQGCVEKELVQMLSVDAVDFFCRQGIRGTYTEIEQVCEPYGYHPLSLRLLAGLIATDFQQPGDIAAAKRLDVSGDLVQRQHHVLEIAYDSLLPKRKALLSRIACFRSPVKYEALKALAETPVNTYPFQGDGAQKAQSSVEARAGEGAAAKSEDEGAKRTRETELDADLRDLMSRGLLHHDKKENRFDLHPIVRRYAYDRLAVPDRVATHIRLRDYFSAIPKLEKVTRLEDLAPVIELYHHTVRAGQFDEASKLYRDRLDELYYQFGSYQLIIDLMRPLFPDGEDWPPRLKDENAQAWTLNELANSYSLSGQPRRSVPLFKQAFSLLEKQVDNKNLATNLSNVADDQLKSGSLRAAESNLRRSINLSHESNDEFREAMGLRELSRLLAYSGVYTESEKQLLTPLKRYEKQNHIQGQGIVWAYQALCELLRLRSSESSESQVSSSALESAQRALKLADETARTSHPFERDCVRAHWLLGAAYRVTDQPEEAENHFHQALERCRRINCVELEADILIDMARLQANNGEMNEALRLAEEALNITERCGYVLQGADANLVLARLSLIRNDKVSAKEYAQKAKDLAFCDGPPDYTYKAAYEEAGGLLKNLE